MTFPLITHSLAALSGALLIWLFSAKSEKTTAKFVPDAKAVSLATAGDNAASPLAPFPRESTSQSDGTGLLPTGLPLSGILTLRDPVARLDALTKWAQGIAASGADGVQMLKTIKKKVLRQAAEAAFDTTLAQSDASLAFHLASAKEPLI